MADNYFNGEPGVVNYLKGVYHWASSKPYLLGESEARVVPLTGTVPLPSTSPIGSYETIKRAGDALKSLGPVVKTVNGVKYYKNAAGEVKTAQEIAKEIKAARDAAKLAEIEKIPNASARARATWEMNNPDKVRRSQAYIDLTAKEYSDWKNSGAVATTARKSNFGRKTK